MKVNILCVCAVGVGSSLMLKMNAEKILKANGHQSSIENTNAIGAGGKVVDIVITSEAVNKQIKNCECKELIVMDNLVSKRELETKLMLAVEKL
jgi:PTS system ascorbate-specific IIB component